MNIQDHAREAMHAMLDQKRVPVSTSLEHLRSQHRALIARTTDAAKNAADPYGDGDQRPVVADFPGQPGQDL